jgi:hypothetical protein
MRANKKALMTEFGDRCDASPRSTLIRSALVGKMFHDDGDGGHDDGRWYAVFEVQQGLFVRPCAIFVGLESASRQLRTAQNRSRENEARPIAPSSVASTRSATPSITDRRVQCDEQQ